MIPYTRDAVATIRAAVNNGTPADLVRENLGWSPSMFDGICRKHGIDARSSPPVDGVPIAPAPPPKREPALEPLPVTITLPLELASKYKKFAGRAGVSVWSSSIAVVDDYLAANSVADIVVNNRRTRGSCPAYQHLNLKISHQAAPMCEAFDV